jgi:hypothetical protein
MLVDLWEETFTIVTYILLYVISYIVIYLVAWFKNYDRPYVSFLFIYASLVCVYYEVDDPTNSFLKAIHHGYVYASFEEMHQLS